MSADDPAKRVAEEYYQHLLDLTENSRPIISNLTELANENVAYADQIVKSIESRIKSCLPNYKLFALYLLDSICKNIGNPYNILFGAKIYQIFTSVYSVVSDSIRNKLINLFKTWKVGRTLTGAALFPQEHIDRIEQFLIKATSGNKVDKNFLIKDCHDLLQLIEKRRQLNPSEHDKIENKIGALNELLGHLMNTNLSQDELKYIMEHFKSVRADEQHIIAGLEFELKQQLEYAQLQEKQLLDQQAPQEAEQTTGINLGFNLSDLTNLLRPKTSEELLEELTKQHIAKPKIKMNKDIDYLKFILNCITVQTKPIEEVLAKYDNCDESFILSNVPTDDDLQLLFDHKRHKCSVCGKRFKMQSSIQPHLDWHFRNNKNLKVNSTKTISSRNYYIGDSQFVDFKEDEIVGYANSQTVKLIQQMESAQAESTKEDNKRHYVVIQTESMNGKCSVCKEVIHGKYDDDINEWIWDNCIEVSQKQYSKLYHWNCYNENIKSTAATAAAAASQASSTNISSTGLNFDLNLLKNIVNPNQVKKE